MANFKYIYLLVITTLYISSCLGKEKDYTSVSTNDTIVAINDSVYISLQSPCNIWITFMGNDTLVAHMGRKKITGVLKKNKYNKNYYNFYLEKAEEDSLIFILGKQERYFIVNQDYHLSCTSSKVVFLTKEGSKKNIAKINEFLSLYPELLDKPAPLTNKASFLIKTHAYKEAAYLLEKVIVKFPDHTVAYINLGDAYWGLGNKAKAKQIYQTYVQQMKAAGKVSKIPQRVTERLK